MYNGASREVSQGTSNFVWSKVEIPKEAWVFAELGYWLGAKLLFNLLTSMQLGLAQKQTRHYPYSYERSPCPILCSNGTF